MSENYGELAVKHGWTATEGTTIQGQPCTVWQRGDEIAIWLPHPTGTAVGTALYNGQVLDSPGLLEAYLVSSPRKRPFVTGHLEGDKEGIIAWLAAKMAERSIQATGYRPGQREYQRLSGEAHGLYLAIGALQDWDRK